MIRKLINLIKNYDKIMEMVEMSKPNVDCTIKKANTKKKSYSLFNTPDDQKEYILDKQKGEI